VLTVVGIFKEVSEVSQRVKASHETCDNCLGYGNKANPPVGILPYPKTTFSFNITQKPSITSLLCNKANPPVGILPYPKTTFSFNITQKPSITSHLCDRFATVLAIRSEISEEQCLKRFPNLVRSRSGKLILRNKQYYRVVTVLTRVSNTLRAGLRYIRTLISA